MQREFTTGLTEPESFRLHHDALGRLVLTESDGREYADVEPARAFPISDPGNRVSIRDAHGHEIRWIERLTELPPEVRDGPRSGSSQAGVHAHRETDPAHDCVHRAIALGY